MERVRKPIPASETLGWVGEGCSAGISGRRQGHSLCVGTGPPHPAHRQWLPNLLSAWSWPVSPDSIPWGRPTPVTLFVLQGMPISHHTGLRALPNYKEVPSPLQGWEHLASHPSQETCPSHHHECGCVFQCS